jgi:acetyl/propionyl-CoA carboxylase alpha subunit
MAQEEAIQIGATSPKKIYNALTEFTKAAGFPSPERFWDEPPEGPMPQQPNPEQIKIEGQLQIEDKKQVGETDRKRMELDSQERIKRAELDAQAQNTDRTIHAERQNQDASLNADVNKHQMTVQNQKPAVSMDVTGAVGEVIDRIEARFSEQAQQQAQMNAQMLGQVVQVLSQAMKESNNYDEIVVRDKKSGRAVGKKRVPAGTLQ